ncbi:uncharacterized protein LOC113356261 [Papaver somniferum]|uniref:uncharacterized protein LOC113356261 n=1 Tax=Papaver somniferum TaxID=3469 RepID=UPI000E6F6DC1|nr:uncharacterized protein LOC113356261 [Papaver somniferum]
MMGRGDPTLQEVSAQQQLQGGRLSVLENHIKDIKINLSSIQETLNQILGRLPMSAVSSPNSPPVPGSINEDSNKVPIPTNSIGDFTVFSSEITTSIATGVDDEKDSLNFELIPPFFFIEKEDVDSLHGVRLQFEEHSKLETNGFSGLNQIKIGEVTDSALEFYFNKFEEKFENHEYFKELLSIFYIKLNCVACSSSLLNATRSLFDRGHTWGELWMRGVMQEHFMCYGCYSVFILSTQYSQPLPFNTPTILGETGVGGKLQECLLQECNARNQNFTKVYFFKYIIRIASICASLPTAEYIRLIFDRGKEIEPIEWWCVYDRHISKFHLTSCLLVSNGLNFTDACAGEYAPEMISEFRYHLILFLGVLHVLEFVITGERYDASQLVNEMPEQSISILLQMTRQKGIGGAPEPDVHLLIKVISLVHLMTLYKHNTVSRFSSTIYTSPSLLLLLLPQMSPVKGSTPCQFLVIIHGMEMLHQSISPKANADMNGGVATSTYPAGGVDDSGPAVYHGQLSTTRFRSMCGLYRKNSYLGISLLCVLQTVGMFSRLSSPSLAILEAAASDTYQHVPAQERRVLTTPFTSLRTRMFPRSRECHVPAQESRVALIVIRVVVSI